MKIHPRAVAYFASTAVSLAFFVPQTQAFTGTFSCAPSPRNTVRLAAAGTDNSFNPMKSLGDMASSLFGSAGNAELDAALSSLVTASWEDVKSNLHAKQTDSERMFRVNLEKGYDPASPLHRLRLYDESNKEEDVRVTLYRDSASWCPYCQKVWTMLEEKRIPYRVEKINMSCYGDKPFSFRALQPSGQIPVAIIDGVTYGQSNDIMSALEEKFPEHKSMRPPPGKEMKAQELLRLERQIFSVWLYWLTGGGGARRRMEFEETLNEVEAALKSEGGPFFLGKDVTLVDMMLVPFLERMCASLLYFKGYQIRVPPGEKTKFPMVNKWFDAMESLKSYQLTKSDYYTHCWDLPPQLAGCVYEPEAGELFVNAINGERSLDQTQGSWELPLQPHNGGIEPDWEWAGNEDEARREAAERISANHENIVAFAARGAGSKGLPSYGAPLADPNAVPNEGVKSSVDAVLRTASLALLDGVEQHESAMQELAKTLVEQGGMDHVQDVIKSVAYLRDRVGVPRDMRLPAARQLRAHLNWSIGKILDAQEG